MDEDLKVDWLAQTISPLTLESTEDGIRISWNLEEDPLNFCHINRAQAEAAVTQLQEMIATL